jgi:hypothetical protein
MNLNLCSCQCVHLSKHLSLFIHKSIWTKLSTYRGGPGSNPGLVKWDLWWTKWRWGRFSPSTSVFPDNLHSTIFSTIIITQSGYNRPFSGRRADWTQFGLHPPLCELKKIQLTSWVSVLGSYMYRINSYWSLIFLLFAVVNYWISLSSLTYFKLDSAATVIFYTSHSASNH